MTAINSERFALDLPENQRDADAEYLDGLSTAFENGLGRTIDRLSSFPKFTPRGALSRFLVKDRLFQEIVNVHGHIIECGVFLGAGLLTWAQLSSIYEPINHVRRIVGFDTFSGFPSVHKHDSASAVNPHLQAGGYAAPAYDELLEAIRLYDLARPLGHIPRVNLVKGDAVDTIPNYVANSAHLVVAMLYLDFDLYEPTKVAIETFLPRMPKGAVIAFDELNIQQWPGETMAVLETVGIRNLRIRRFPFQPTISYAVLE